MASEANSVLNQVLDAVRGMTGCTIKTGPLPPANSLSMVIASGGPDSTFQNKGFSYSIDVTFNGMNADQFLLADTMNGIHETLTQTKDYPAGDRWHILNISTTTAPSYLGTVENNQYLYGSSLRVRFFYHAKQDDAEKESDN